LYFLNYVGWGVERSSGTIYIWNGSSWVIGTPSYTVTKIDLPYKARSGSNPYSHQFRGQFSVPDNAQNANLNFYFDMFLQEGSIAPGTPGAFLHPFTGSASIIQELNDNLTTYNNSTNTKASKVLELDSYYYDGFGSDSIGSIQVYDGSAWSNSNSWVAAGPTSGSFENIYVKQVLGFYSKAVKSVKTNVRDNGGYNGLKTLSFDSSIWVSNGYVWGAMSETYDGEWLKLYGDYTSVDTGETEYYNDPSNQNEFRIQQLESSVDALNGVDTNLSSNLSINLFYDKPGNNPTIDTLYNVNINYNPTDQTASFQLTELGSLTTLTSGTHTASVLTPSMLCNTTDGNVTVNLPAANTSKGVEFWFKKTATNHKVIVNGTIDSAGHLDINNLHGSVIIVSDGTVYWIKSIYP
jgi:hypothetical protein